MKTLSDPSLPKTGTKLPPKDSTPSWLQTFHAIVNPMPYLEKTRQKYGDLYRGEFVGFPKQVIVSHPQAIQQIFTAEANQFESGSGNKITEPLLGPNSLILLDGDRHQQQRKLLMPPFHGERMRSYGQTIADITQKLISKWQVNQPIIARPNMQEISLNVILQTIFGLQEGEKYQEIRKALIGMLDTFDQPLNAVFLFFKILQKDLGVLTPWGNFLRYRKELDQLLYQEIRTRRNHPESWGEDILSLLLSARDENGDPMTDEELRDELITMLFAGHETTATALAWSLYWIHSLPEVKSKLLAEIQSIDLNNLDPVEISRLPYLNAVCSETLRLYPIVFFALPRIAQTPIKLMDYEFPKGTIFAISIYLTHHRPETYPEPKKFNPERFLERQFSPYEYLPFGGGHRRCIGSAFALFEMKIVLATLLTRCSFTLAETKNILPVRRGLTFTPAGGVRLIPTAISQ